MGAQRNTPLQKDYCLVQFREYFDMFLLFKSAREETELLKSFNHQ